VLAAFDLTATDRAELMALLKAWTSLAGALAQGQAPAVPIYASPAAVNQNSYADATDASTTADSGEAAGLGPARLTITPPFPLLSQGSSQIGIINHYYFYRLQAEVGKSAVHAALAYFAPHDPGYVLDISGAAVLKSSKHQAAAQKLVAFITSTAGQTILAHSESFEYPIGPRRREPAVDPARPVAAELILGHRARYRRGRENTAATSTAHLGSKDVPLQYGQHVEPRCGTLVVKRPCRRRARDACARSSPYWRSVTAHTT